MANTPTQTGSQWKIGIGSLAYTGYRAKGTVNSEPVAQDVVIRGVDGETVTVITYDPAKTFKGSFYILDSGGSITPPIKNSTITLTPPEGTSTTYRVVSASVTVGSVGEDIVSVLTVDLIKETAMTY